jgi:hypothetical protein
MSATVDASNPPRITPVAVTTTSQLQLTRVKQIITHKTILSRSRISLTTTMNQSFLYSTITPTTSSTLVPPEIINPSPPKSHSVPQTYQTFHPTAITRTYCSSHILYYSSNSHNSCKPKNESIQPKVNKRRISRIP